MMKVNYENNPLSLALMDYLVLKAVVKHQHLPLSPGQVPLIIQLSLSTVIWCLVTWSTLSTGAGSRGTTRGR